MVEFPTVCHDMLSWVVCVGPPAASLLLSFDSSLSNTNPDWRRGLASCGGCFFSDDEDDDDDCAPVRFEIDRMDRFLPKGFVGSDNSSFSLADVFLYGFKMTCRCWWDDDDVTDFALSFLSSSFLGESRYSLFELVVFVVVGSELM